MVSDSSDIGSIHVLNKSLGRFTITDDNGRFAIRASLNDTLTFSSVQFKRKEIKITRELFEKAFVKVILEVQVNELDEITLFPYNLTGDLSKDLKNVDQDKIVTGVSLGLPNQYVKERTQTERRIYEARTGSGMIPLNPILNAITGRTKRLKQQLKLEQKASRDQTILNTYARGVYSEIFGIPDDYIEGFIIYCAFDPQFETVYSKSDALEMLEFLKLKSEAFNKEGVFIKE